MQPAPGMCALIKDLLRKTWDAQAAKAKEATALFKKEAAQAGKEINDLVNRVITAYEKRIDEPEKKKLMLEEKAAKTKAPKHSFDKILELSFLLLTNPRKLRENGPF